MEVLQNWIETHIFHVNLIVCQFYVNPPLSGFFVLKISTEIISNFG
ncbi:Uncharacterised protein [Klebsiella aerogenes]|nr:Uncharacterised protein [Klebsiella aerogenes]